MAAVFSGGNAVAIDRANFADFRLHEVIVTRQKRELQTGICYASDQNLKPAQELGYALARWLGGDEYTIVLKPIGRSAKTRNPEK